MILSLYMAATRPEDERIRTGLTPNVRVTAGLYVLSGGRMA